MSKKEQRKKQNKKQQEKSVESTVANLEINYDKLATAIIQAQEQAKAHEEEKFTKGTFSLLTSWVLHTIGALGFLIALYAFGYGIYHAITVLQWVDGLHVLANIITCIFILTLTLCVGVLSFMLFKSGSEIQKSKDKNFIVAVFSALSGFIALIVALIALFK